MSESTAAMNVPASYLEPYEYGLRRGQLEMLLTRFTQETMPEAHPSPLMCIGARERHEVCHALRSLATICQEISKRHESAVQRDATEALLTALDQRWEAIYEAYEKKVLDFGLRRQKLMIAGMQLHSRLMAMIRSTGDPEPSKWADLAYLLATGFVRVLPSDTEGFEFSVCPFSADEMGYVWADAERVTTVLTSLNVEWDELWMTPESAENIAALLPYQKDEVWPWFLLEARLRAVRPERGHGELQAGRSGTGEDVWIGPQSPKEWCRQFSFSQSTFTRHIEDGKLRVDQISTKSYRIHRDDVERYTVVKMQVPDASTSRH
jgi:hypothetical protein